MAVAEHTLEQGYVETDMDAGSGGSKSEGVVVTEDTTHHAAESGQYAADKYVRSLDDDTCFHRSFFDV